MCAHVSAEALRWDLAAWCMAYAPSRMRRSMACHVSVLPCLRMPRTSFSRSLSGVSAPRLETSATSWGRERVAVRCATCADLLQALLLGAGKLGLGSELLRRIDGVVQLPSH